MNTQFYAMNFKFDSEKIDLINDLAQREVMPLILGSIPLVVSTPLVGNIYCTAIAYWMVIRMGIIHRQVVTGRRTILDAYEHEIDANSFRGMSLVQRINRLYPTAIVVITLLFAIGLSAIRAGLL